ncbi:ATP-binding cassette domain-containing protein [Naasia lichenicola]|uniref:ATP-binding cassette domain-containing protein n=1 Tax=Naasia lichenicola TaxID=2565933 RepID=UPI00130EF2FF|nr:ATP-binding cassette domain-containing protein [Naasia lichenicola]
MTDRGNGSASSPGNQLLRVEGLSKTFYTGGPPWARRRVHALDDVSITVEKGQTLGIVGESGSGKSTLGRCILGLTKPDSGRVVFDGQDIAGLGPRALSSVRRRVQPVFQDPYGSLDPRWTVGRSVRESLDSYRIGTPADRDRRVLDLFDRVGLNPDFASRLPGSLSGGQRQRVGIAAALASEPDLIIADEPVSALDVSVQAQILNLFMDLQNDLGVASVFITHDLGVVEHVSDRIAVLYHGVVVETGDVDQVMRRPTHDYTRTLLAAIPIAAPAPTPEN